MPYIKDNLLGFERHGLFSDDDSKVLRLHNRRRRTKRKYGDVRAVFSCERFFHLPSVEHAFVNEQLHLPKHYSEDELFVLRDDGGRRVSLCAIPFENAPFIELRSSNHNQHWIRNGLFNLIPHHYDCSQRVADSTIDVFRLAPRRRTPLESPLSQVEHRHVTSETWKND